MKLDVVNPLVYKYNGKEYQDELGLNVTAMDFRQYDNALGRFTSMDKRTEMNMSLTAYRFSYNNPIFWTDKTGLWEEVNYKKDGKQYSGIKITDEKEIEAFLKLQQDNPDSSTEDLIKMVQFDQTGTFAMELETVTVVGSQRDKTFQNAKNGTTASFDLLDRVGNDSSKILKDRFKYAPEFYNKSITVRTPFKFGIETNAKFLRNLEKGGKLASKLGKGLVIADVALSGEVRASHLLSGAMIGVNAIPVVGNAISGIYFTADLITMGVSYMNTGEAKGIGDYLDESLNGGVIVNAKDIGIEYDGIIK